MFGADSSVLRWSTPEQQFHAKAGDGKIVTAYPFKNTGANPVRIAGVATTCVCTTAKLAKEVFAPGEEGQLEVEFDVGPQVGRQERSITVTTDEASVDPTVLKIVVDIAELVSIHPKLLFWKMKERGEEKEVLVTLADPGRVKIGELRVTSADFSARLERDEKSGRYKIWIKPIETARSTQTVIRLEATIEGRVQSFSIFAAVRS